MSQICDIHLCIIDTMHNLFTGPVDMHFAVLNCIVHCRFLFHHTLLLAFVSRTLVLLSRSRFSFLLWQNEIPLGIGRRKKCSPSQAMTNAERGAMKKMVPKWMVRMPWSPIVLFCGTHLHYQVPLWASLGDIQDIDECTLKIEGDLLCELAAVIVHLSSLSSSCWYLLDINTTIWLQCCRKYLLPLD